MRTNRASRHSSDIRLWAEKLGAGCFLNALLREWNGWELTAPDKSTASNPDTVAVVTIPLQAENGNVLINLQHYSPAGRHQFQAPCWLQGNGSDNPKAITFAELVELLSREESIFGQVNEDTLQIFLQRVESSLENTGQTLSARAAELSDIYTGKMNFQASEQALFAGHSFHPTPKSRDQFSTEETQRYIPESGASFQLYWFSIESDLLEADSVHEHSFRQLTMQLASEDGKLKSWLPRDLPDHHTLLPAHPWQARQWLKSAYIRKLMQQGIMVDYGELGSDWRATSSVRAIHAPHASFMLKYSLSVRLTNSLRHLLPKEVIRGKEIHQVKYQTEVGQELRERFPDFDILTEPAHAAIKDADGQPLPETMIVLRENPFASAGVNEGTELLASLTQDHPSESPRIVERISQLAQTSGCSQQETALLWFEKYLSIVVKPLVVAQADFGLLFGAHQQNLLIHMPDGYPRKAWFRDCQGTGYSQLARQLLTGDIPATSQTAEHHVEEELGNRLFTYYLLINSTFGVISALGSGYGINEQSLLLKLREFLEDIRTEGRRDQSCLDYMLDSNELWSKGNFFCSFNNLNENTLENPLDIYHPMKNPLQGLSDSA
ncbi:MAG: IucA/IucC family protein [Endozoicomonas sp.]